MKKIIIAIITLALVFFAFYTLIKYAWIGAEYCIDGVVHFGKVDAFVVTFICCLAVDHLFGDAIRKRK